MFVVSMGALAAQETEGNFLKDKRTGCRVWFKHTFTEDSATWTGACKNGLADGKGQVVGYTKGKETSRYTGALQAGKPHGEGVFTFGGGRQLQGNFREGEPLFLSAELLQHWKRTVVAEADSSNAYVGDDNRKQLFYDALVPPGTVKGVVVLLPGTWTSTEYLFSSMRTFCELAYKQQIAVVALSLNQRLTLNAEMLQLMNSLMAAAIAEYQLPRQKFVLGGWSMGGLFSLRYAEFANQDSLTTVVKPAAVFSCDGPCDLAHVYANFVRKLGKNPGQNEPAYGIRELSTYCGGTPATAAEKYRYYSAYSHLEPGGGNARYLAATPVRIYADVDPEWWLRNRHVDAYDLNALDQTAMVLVLQELGNSKAEFINAYQKGVRLEGTRHPHSWSIVEPNDCLRWILDILN